MPSTLCIWCTDTSAPSWGGPKPQRPKSPRPHFKFQSDYAKFQVRNAVVESLNYFFFTFCQLRTWHDILRWTIYCAHISSVRKGTFNYHEFHVMITLTISGFTGVYFIQLGLTEFWDGLIQFFSELKHWKKLLCICKISKFPHNFKSEDSCIKYYIKTQVVLKKMDCWWKQHQTWDT